MTREEAIEGFRHSIIMSKLDLKVNKKKMSIEREIMVLNSIARNEMAIKALEQEHILDKIKEEIRDNTYFINETTEKEGIDFETVEKIIDKYKKSEGKE